MSSVTKVETLQDLDAHLRNKIDDVELKLAPRPQQHFEVTSTPVTAPGLSVCVTLRGGWAADTVEEMQQQARQLEAMKQEVARYRSSITSGRQLLSDSSALLKTMQQLSLRITHMKEHLPHHMPLAAPQRKSRPKKSPSEEESKGQTPAAQPKHTTPKPAAPKAKQVPKVEFITTEEFEKVPTLDGSVVIYFIQPYRQVMKKDVEFEWPPAAQEALEKYIRGRLQYVQVNAAVEEINKALEAKYALLSRPRAKLSSSNMKIVAECRRQENKESKVASTSAYESAGPGSDPGQVSGQPLQLFIPSFGVDKRVPREGSHFVVDGDIKRWSSLKMDTAGKSILTMLRTLKRVREVRGPGSLVRYTVLT
ncbi:Spindle and kinetochore-associated protein 1 [Chionoecetes opilio]|uniref:SKA complex subunit 1 n=1 Tax=Chionoecetes opilio TaxID=41210 RepID=A0A8J4YJ70_CHIOP|nr:Spindle and kinetochore-associated protein 1 [Chionoecetes opilio]